VPIAERTRLDVILESSGGSIDAAYNIALLLRRYAKDELNIIIPRWAKSAATVIACAGDKIFLNACGRTWAC
jgi:ClpP class serine protease